MKYLTAITFLALVSCTPAAPTVDQKARELITAEIIKNSMGLIENIEMEITWEDDATALVDYRFEVPAKPGKWRTVNMKYVFDREVTKITHKERL